MQYKNIFKIGLCCLIALWSLNSCKDDDTASSVYMPDAKGVVQSNFDLNDTIEYSVTLTGADYPTVTATAGKNIDVTFAVAKDLVPYYNEKSGTEYTLLPEANYEFQSSASIAAGTSGTFGLKLIIKNGETLEPFSSFLLPLTINQVSGASANQSQQTTYFVITRSPAVENLPTFDRSKWTIAGFSTEEPGEGGGNGLAKTVLDDNPGTFWHTKWAGGEPGPPHFITIDMGETKMIHGISIIDRYFEGSWAIEGHGQPKAISVSVSTDGTNWIDSGSFQVPLPPEDEPQSEIRFFLSKFKEVRYFRITVTGVWATSSASIAEIYAL